MSDDSPKQSDTSSQLFAATRLVGFLGLCLALLPVYWLTRWARPQQTSDLVRHFYGALLKVMGFRVRVHGHMTDARPTLFVANHASYLDIPVLGSIIPAYFVAKADVAGWPLFGFYATMLQTVYVERRVMRTSEQTQTLRSRLASGQNLILFPEGTSSDGLAILPFKSSFFAVAEDVGRDMALTVQPVSIACTEFDGLPVTRALRPTYSWYGDMTLIGHLWNVFCLGSVTMDIVFHPPLTPQEFPDRKALATACQERVARGIEQCITGRIEKGDPMRLVPSPKD